MISVGNGTIAIEKLLSEYPKDSIESKILNTMNSSDKIYSYESLEYLKFEINLRINIIKASVELNHSKFAFKVFKKSTCNPTFWERTKEGGFLLKDNVRPSEAINDIYENSHLYGTECSTAILIVYYRALLGIYPEVLFDEMFNGLQLMNWHYIDSDLGVNTYDNLNDFFPGDCRYFANPEVDPEKIEWQGENAIDLGTGKYYGHGLGIGTADEIIKALNKHRKPKATETSYLLNSATRPNFKHLAYRYLKHLSEQQRIYLIRFFYHNNEF